MYQLLQSMMIKVELLVIVHMDNVGVISMTKIITTNRCSKHVDICYKFVTEYVNDVIIKVILVKSADKYSDIMTTIKDQNCILNMQVK